MLNIQVVIHLTTAARYIFHLLTPFPGHLQFISSTDWCKSDLYGSVGTHTQEFILKCNWTMNLALFPTFQSNAGYKYPQ